MNEEITQKGISSWSTDLDMATEFAEMRTREKDIVAPVKVVFEIEDNETGVSIKHLAPDYNDEVIHSSSIRYIKQGDAELIHDDDDGDYWLIKLKEIYE